MSVPAYMSPRRRNVEHGDALDRMRMIEAQAMRDAPPRSWPTSRKRAKPSVAHQLDLIRRHRALRVADVACAAVGLRRIAVAAEVGAHDGEALREARRDPVPHRVRLRITVQQQERRPAAADIRSGFPRPRWRRGAS